MSLAHKRKEKSFLGHMVVLVLTALVVFLFINLITNYQINQIIKINNKHFVSPNILVPENNQEYKLELKDLNDKKYTTPIIKYIDYMLEAKKIERHIEYSYLETNCVTRTTLSKIEMQVQNKELLLDSFLEIQSKKLNKLNWNDYIESLYDYNIENIREKAKRLEIC